MGLARVESHYLPLEGRQACQLCVDECNAAGYHTIEFMRVHPTLDTDVDDAFALALVLASPELDLRGGDALYCADTGRLPTQFPRGRTLGVVDVFVALSRIPLKA